MKAFRFELETALKHAQRERDVARQTLAVLLREQAALEARQAAAEAARQTQFDRLRRDERPGELDIEASRRGRAHALRLSDDFELLSRRQADLSLQIDQSRQRLLRADQAAAALEKLAERRQAEFRVVMERREQHDLEEACRSRPGIEPIRS